MTEERSVDKERLSEVEYLLHLLEVIHPATGMLEPMTEEQGNAERELADEKRRQEATYDRWMKLGAEYKRKLKDAAHLELAKELRKIVDDSCDLASTEQNFILRAAEALETTPPSPLAAPEHAVGLLREIDDSGVLFRHAMELDAKVANMLHRIDSTPLPSQERLSTLVHPKCHDEGCQAALALKAAPSTATPSAEALYWADEILSRATDYRAPSIICATELKRLAGIDMPQSSSPHEKKPHV